MVMSQTVGELEYTNEETLNLGADFKSTNDENSILGGDIELHILDKSGIVKELSTSPVSGSICCISCFYRSE